LINDKAGWVSVVLDAPMMALEPLNYHPLENTATTAISGSDLISFIRATGHEPRVLKVSTDAGGGAGHG